jgi:hypothetical protein
MFDSAKAWECLSLLARFLIDSREEKLRLDQVERELFGHLLELGRRLLESYVVQAGNGDVGVTVEHLQHGLLRRSTELHAKPYQSIFGEFQINRWTYHEREGQKALHVPLDMSLGLPDQKQSYVLEDWLERLTISEPFEQAVKTLNELLGVKTSVRSAERINRKLANYAQTLEQELSPPAPEQEHGIIVVTADGKGVPMRRSLNQRKHEELGEKLYQRQSQLGYEKTQKRLTAGANKSCKQTAYVGAVYTIAPWVRDWNDVLQEIDRETQVSDRPQPQNKRLFVEMTQIIQGELSEGPQQLFSKLSTEIQSGNSEAHPKPVICLMDGQRSLWFRQREYLPQAIAILDIFHVIEYLWQAAYCHHPQGSLAAEKYVNKYLKRILQGKVDNVIRSLKQQQPTLQGNKVKELAKVISYLKTNRRHMKYDQYLAQGYPIGSGVIEGACRHVVKDRMELSGMRWEIEGAQSMLRLRTTYLNGNWDKLIEHRIQCEQKVLYSQAA